MSPRIPVRKLRKADFMLVSIVTVLTAVLAIL